ncbi:hypothetical protein KY329_05115 [Candidatus Woesearchaeota archaeon]|nr:hypothetical protein [Candidatus Woesearchaeota archaeon]
MEKEKNMPEKRFSTGGIVATVWKNNQTANGKEYEYKTVSLQRRYADKEGKWQTSSSMRLNDLPKAALVLEEAYKYLVLNSDQS